MGGLLLEHANAVKALAYRERQCKKEKSRCGK
jgi:hypothetical protein